MNMERQPVDCLSFFPTVRPTFNMSDVSYDIKLESESSELSASDMDESVSSGQMELTASCQDTPDTESSSLEFSLVSGSSSSVTVPEVSSGPEDVCEPFYSMFMKPKSCVQCQKIKHSPFLYCSSCYLARKRFYPVRRTGIKKKRRIPSKVSLAAHTESSPPNSAAEEIPSQEIHLKPAYSLCSCCMDAPCNGVFIHGDLGHQLMCYKCSHRIWLLRKNCPYCNRAITKVVKLFRADME